MCHPSFSSSWCCLSYWYRSYNHSCACFFHVDTQQEVKSRQVLHYRLLAYNKIVSNIWQHDSTSSVNRLFYTTSYEICNDEASWLFSTIAEMLTKQHYNFCSILSNTYNLNAIKPTHHIILYHQGVASSQHVSTTIHHTQQYITNTV
jgi:hypothetical protein